MKLNSKRFCLGDLISFDFPDTYYPYPMGLPNFCYHLAIKEMAINGKIRLVSLVVYNYILPRKTGKCNQGACASKLYQDVVARQISQY